MTKVIVIGGGGHAKVVIDILRLTSMEIYGIIDPKLTKGTTRYGLPILGDDDVLLNYKPWTILLVNGVGSIKTNQYRELIHKKFSDLDYKFKTLIHPSAIVASDALINEGAHVMAGVVIQPGSWIGENTIINTKASVDHDSVIGSHVHICPGVTISGNVIIQNNCFVGSGSTIINGIKIGKASLVGAGTVVINDIPEYSVVTGVPGRVHPIGV